jgi:DNA-binding NarL/FixJ family response regulator
MGISVFIIDQERTFTDALAAGLEAEEDVEVAVAVHRQAPAPSLIVGRHADVVLLDGDLPGNAAIHMCEELSGREDAPRVVMLSRSSDAGRIADSVRVGAAAWVSKTESLAHLIRVIRGVAAGETWLPPAKTGAVLRLLMQERQEQCESDRLLASLTAREREVLACLAEGAGRRDVAERLHLSAHTVRTHLQNLMAKLGVHSTLEAVALTRAAAGSACSPSRPALRNKANEPSEQLRRGASGAARNRRARCP